MRSVCDFRMAICDKFACIARTKINPAQGFSNRLSLTRDQIVEREKIMLSHTFSVFTVIFVQMRMTLAGRGWVAASNMHPQTPPPSGLIHRNDTLALQSGLAVLMIEGVAGVRDPERNRQKRALVLDKLRCRSQGWSVRPDAVVRPRSNWQLDVMDRQLPCHRPRRGPTVSAGGICVPLKTPMNRCAPRALRLSLTKSI